jgi:acarbose 7IV-phosphotransferase
MDPKHAEVVVVGNVGIDTNVYFNTNAIDFSVEANFTSNLDMVGQAGGYASRAYARLGHKTAFLGYVGADFSGDFIKQEFISEGIDIQGFWVDPEGTSRSINFMYPDGQRKNFYDGKSHMTLHPSLETAAEILQGAKLAHFNIPNWARELLPLARQVGVKIACDIQDVTDSHDPYRTDFIKHSDFLFFSAANYADPRPIISHFIALNPNLIIICGMGKRGCALATASAYQSFSAVEIDLPVIDTNGAGDALAAGFLSSYVLHGRSVEESILRGQISARYKCAQKASSSNMITSSLLDHYQESFR